VKNFLRILGFEGLQNLPAVLGLVSAHWLWTRNQHLWAIFSVVLGSVCSVAAIALTERAQLQRTSLAPSPPPAPSEMAMFAMGFSAGAILLVAYLDARWSDLWTDLLLGAGAGAILALFEIFFTAEPPPLARSVSHALSFAVMGPVVLIGVRVTKGAPLGWALLAALPLTLAMSLIIALIDYGPFLRSEP
jgi:hypothetical protein